MPFHEVGYVAGSDEHDTPLDFFSPISDAVGGFDLDPSASSTSELAARNIREDEDGLSVPWSGRVWLNPPYSEVSDWMEYAAQEYYHGDADLITALVFARTSTRWWHNHARTAELACFVKGRLKFGGASNGAPAPSVVLVWGDPSAALRDALHDMGHIVYW